MPSAKNVSTAAEGTSHDQEIMGLNPIVSWAFFIFSYFLYLCILEVCP